MSILVSGLDTEHFACIPKLYFFHIVPVGLIISKYLNLLAENVKNSETGGLKDSWQNGPLLTF